MDIGSRIGSMNVIKGLSLTHLHAYSSIGNLNWITGFPISNKDHFQEDKERNPSLVLGSHSAITNRHLIDCTAQVSLGNFSTFAGFRSQILTHSISILDNKQKSAPVFIGDYCFVGTASILLPGAVIPNYTVVGAMSLVNKEHIEEYTLLGGTPAGKIKSLRGNEAYFQRETGFVK